MNKFYKPLANLTKMSREKDQISKIRNEKVAITTNTEVIWGIIRDYFENLYSNKLENLEEMDTFLDTYDHSKLNQEDINHLNRSIKHNEIEEAIVFPKRKLQDLTFSTEFYQTFKEELIPALLNFLRKN
jgi:hypothetical protein